MNITETNIFETLKVELENAKKLVAELENAKNLVTELESQIQENQEKTTKEIGFDRIEQKFGLNNNFRTKDLIKCFFPNQRRKMALGMFPWHIYGNNGYLLKPGYDGRYLYKVTRGIWRLEGEKYIK